jgi:uncharacterized membrane protein YozB (DUF420 family)
LIFIFWTCWIIDLLLLLLAFGGKGFRSGFGADTSLNGVVIVITGVVLAASLVLQFSGKHRSALLVAALPLAGMLALYLMEKVNGTFFR